MRRGLLIFAVVNLVILSLLVRSVFTLLSLLVEDAAADAIHRAELPSPNSSLIETRPQVIPKIIHQTYKNETIPEVWREAQRSCIDLHPDYEYIVSFILARVRVTPWGERQRNKVSVLTNGFSCGQMKSHASSLLRNTPGSWTPSMATSTPSSARTQSGISFWRTMAVPTSIWTM